MKTINEILENFSEPEIIEMEKLIFSGIEEKDVYNISKKFTINRQEFIFGRVEPRDNSELSKIFLFRKSDGTWVPDNNFIPLENSEDPFISKIDDEFVLGCVEVIKMEEGSEFDPENKLNYRTILYKGKNPWELKRIFEGPWKMKDIRFVQLPNKKIAVFSRPQGGKAGRGKIGFFIINSLKKLNEKELYEAPLLNNFHESEWEGVNEAHLLNDEKIGILGHIAKRNEDNSLSYYPMIFTINPKNMKHSKIRIILKRENLPKGESKNERLIDVIFPGGFEINNDGTMDLYVGVGDAEAYRIKIKNPF
jgi:hypothetical protein